MIKNPPAFAATAIGPSDDLCHQDGMSLRDWFAGQAVASLFSSDGEFTPEAIARLCYFVADAILIERAKGPDQ